MIEAHRLLDHCQTKGFITAAQAAEALDLSSQWKTPMARTLLAMGIIDTLRLYQAIAAMYQLPFANLHTSPCHAELLDYTCRNDYQHLQMMPWKQEGNVTLIACTEVTDALHQWAQTYYGAEGYQLAITSPHDIQMALYQSFHKEDDLHAREYLWNTDPKLSAKSLEVKPKLRYMLICVFLAVALLLLAPVESLVAVILLANGFYIATLAVKLGLFAVGRHAYKQAKKTQWKASIADKDLPIYTLLVPLFQETAILKKLTDALLALDYPKAKLDIKLIVEEDDQLTIEAIKALKCRRIFEIIRVPYSLPRTKPKACNYALQFARGDYVTIYDAEDIPEPAQLKKALECFAQADEKTVCVQARLNYFNRDENWLTRMFAIEYAGLFDFLLWGIERLNIPIPLGGTSNHFKMNALRALYAWDPYNVTEDADLGIRAAKRGWKVTVMDALTLEEAPISLSPWIRQRSRWIKGHMQTYLVHMRQPITLWKKLGTVGFFGFQFFLGAPCLVFLISPVLWVLWLIGFSGMVAPATSLLEVRYGWVVPFSVSIFFIGFALQLFCAVWTVAAQRWWYLWATCLLYPFYWFLHSVASFRAIWQLFRRPHYWEKTQHGVTKIRLEVTK